ncbi:hypothetical protein INT43_005999 [Umbelopsis isabellina]|uniref:Uncharacterized protein n=1 Tax=Mortierella isabellina TaxID=91625 RepID=A0A8H7UB05_MORIS|nr:hypothetical protein INT43_005999 [Umbelopsis isabellina]
MIKEESCDTMPDNENTASSTKPSEEDGQSSKQPAIDDQSDRASSLISIDSEEIVDKSGRSRFNRVYRHTDAQFVVYIVVNICTPRLTYLLSSSSETVTEIQQDDGANLSLDSFQHVSPDQPEIAEAIDTSESKGSDETLENVSIEALCNAEPPSSTELPDESAHTVVADKSNSSSQLELKNEHITTFTEAQPDTQNNGQKQQLGKPEPVTEVAAAADENIGTQNDTPKNKSDLQTADLSEKEHRLQALRTLVGNHQRATSCVDANSMFDNSQQSFKQHRKRKMSIRRLSDAFTKTKFPSASEFTTSASVQEVPQDKRRFSDMLGSPKQTRQLLRKKSSMLLSRIRSSFPNAKKDAQPAC